MTRARFSFSRWTGIVVKEFIQLRRDRLTFAMIVGIPVIQLLLFGFAINSDPKHLPTAILSQDQSAQARTLVSALQASGYYRVVAQLRSEAEAGDALASGRVQFVVTIPPEFGRKLVRGERPVLLVEADATDPTAVGNATNALPQIAATALRHDLRGVLAPLQQDESPVDVRVHRLYNPEGVTAYNIVPGLLGVILTMTMVLMTGLAMTRERERGTFENLLSTPALPVEVMTGKLVPYIAIGLLQVTLILLAARWIFDVPMQGSLVSLYLAVLLFIAANLTLGITFSSIARNQLQAMQMTFFFFLPSILLSGFMFPFAGMPHWAQVLGTAIPATHFLRLTRKVMLKAGAMPDIAPDMGALALIMAVIVTAALLRYRQTLD